MIQRKYWGTAAALTLAMVMSGCMHTIRETEMQDPPTVVQLSREFTEGEKKLDFKGKRLAVIAFAASSIATFQRTESLLGDGFTKLSEGVGGLVDMANGRPAKGLNQALNGAVASLKALGFEVMPPEQVWQNPAYQAMQTNPHMYPIVKGSRIIVGDDQYTEHGWIPVDRTNVGDEQINALFDGLKVDGVVTAFLSPDSNLLHFGGARLYVKGADGKAQLAWRGRLKKNAAEVERTWTSPFPNDEERVAVTARAYQHTFSLLANRMVQDLK